MTARPEQGRTDDTAPGHAALLARPLAALPDPLPMRRLERPFNIEVRPPGSKSLTNRALLLAALADGVSEVRGALLDAQDGRVMVEALRALGVDVAVHDAAAGGVRITGRAGRLRGGCALSLGNAGTATRFLTAAACLADAPVVIDGDDRMRRRPIGELVALLRTLGVRIDELGAAGCPPLRVHPARPAGGRLTVPTTASSQFVSAVMMLAPWTRDGVEMVFEGEVTSASYVRMTAGLMERLGAGAWRAARGPDAGRMSLPAGPLAAFRYDVEPDASAATYFWAAAAMFPGAACRVPGVGGASLQGDAGFPSILARLGAGATIADSGATVRGARTLRGGRFDMASMPDAAPTLAAVACFAEGATTLDGLRTLRVKETDRLAALQAELRRVGVGVEIRAAGGDESLVITPPPGGLDPGPTAPRVGFDTYDDHRMAMALALVGLRRPNVWIRDPACVRKTYPGFWGDLAKLYG